MGRYIWQIEMTKTRHFPHVDGQWVTHVAVKIGVDSDSLVIPDGFRPVEHELHITLHNLFTLQHFQVQGFLAQMEKIAMSLTRHVVTFDGTRMLKDSSGVNTFYALTLKEDVVMRDLVQNVKKVVDQFKPKVLEEFEEPVLHMSIAVSNAQQSQEIPHPRILGMVKALQCVVGGQVHEFKIKVKRNS